jgi:hypothetical protein
VAEWAPVWHLRKWNKEIINWQRQMPATSRAKISTSKGRKIIVDSSSLYHNPKKKKYFIKKKKKKKKKKERRKSNQKKAIDDSVVACGN